MHQTRHRPLILKLLLAYHSGSILPLQNLNIINNLRFGTHNYVILVPIRVRLVGDKHPPRASLAVYPLLDWFIKNSDPWWIKLWFHVLVPLLLYLPLLKEGIIELKNSNIFVKHNMVDLLNALPRDDVVEADGVSFLGGDGVLLRKHFLKECPT